MSSESSQIVLPDRVRPMRVIGLGPSRTGTLGLYTAMKVLGYRPLHISDYLPYRFAEMKALQEAIITNTAGEALDRTHFDGLWADYDCIIESPCYFFPSVVDAYIQDPDVKFILTERSPESFTVSLVGSLCDYYARLRNFPLCLTRYFDEFIWHLHGLFRAMTMRWSRGLEPDHPAFEQTVKESYIEYLESVRTTVPPERLLVLSLEEGFGWDDICAFLGHPVPNQPYPRINSMTDFHDAAEMLVGPSVRKTWFGLAASAVVALSVGIWHLKRMSIL